MSGETKNVDTQALLSHFSEIDLELFRLFLMHPDHSASIDDVAARLGKNPAQVRFQLAQLATRIVGTNNLDVRQKTNGTYGNYEIFFEHKEVGKDYYHLKLKDSLVSIVEHICLESQLILFPAEEDLNIDELDFFEGGNVIQVGFERNSEARQACLKHYGCKCSVCKFNFEDVYGEMGKGFIHIHHLQPVHLARGKTYTIDPIKDLRPVCPNCHAMLHTRRPLPWSLEELTQQMSHHLNAKEKSQL